MSHFGWKCLTFNGATIAYFALVPCFSGAEFLGKVTMSTDNASARQLWAGIKWLVGLFGGLLLVMLLLSLLFDPQEVTISQSPDGLHKIIVRQSWVAKYYIDRNFRIVLIDTRN
jgi:hypothetical protein